MATRSLDQIREGEAPAELAGAYRSVRHALRTSWVPLFFRALAAHRGLLRGVWRELKPVVTTRGFEERADELRAELARTAADLGTPLLEPVLAAAGFDVDAVDELRAQMSLFHYADPKVLLCVAAVARAAAGERVGGRVRSPFDMMPLPDGAPADMPELLLPPEHQGGIANEIIHEILEATHLPVADVDLRVLGHWPTLLEAAWPALAPVLRHRDAERLFVRVRIDAERLSMDLPVTLDLSPGRLGEGDAHRAALMRLCALFEDAMPRLALFATALTVSLDGPENALASPYPVEWEESESLYS